MKYKPKEKNIIKLNKFLNEKGRNTFGKALGKFNNRGIITVILIAISALSFSQNINFRRVENAHIINVNGDTLSSHSSDIEAIQQLQNYKSKGLEVKMYGAVYDVDVTLQTKIDTIIIDRRIDVDGKPVRAFRDLVLDGSRYMLFKDEGMVKYKPDTLYYWQIRYKFKRIKEFGKVSYEELTIPFQFRDSLNLVAGQTEYKIQTFGTQKHCIKYFIDNQKTELSSCNPGQLSDIEWRHTRTFLNLKPDTEYLIRVEGTTDTEFNIKEFKIKTLQ